MLIKVFCVVSMLSKLGGGGGGGGATGLLNKGGGSNRLPGLVTKQQAVEFPQVLTSTNILALSFCPFFPPQAIEFLSGIEALHSHAVHFAIALHDMDLLYLAEPTQSKLCK